jgi:hypothetical protein
VVFLRLKVVAVAKLAWVVVSQRAIIDGPSNNLSLIDLLEEVTLPPLPSGIDPKMISVIPLRLYVVGLWYRENLTKPETIDTRLVILAPNGKEVGNSAMRIDLRQHARVRSLVQMAGMPFAGVGMYRFITKRRSGKRWQIINEQLVEVKFVDAGSKSKVKFMH